MSMDTAAGFLSGRRSAGDAGASYMAIPHVVTSTSLGGMPRSSPWRSGPPLPVDPSALSPEPPPPPSARSAGGGPRAKSADGSVDDLRMKISALLDQPESSMWAQAIHYFLIVAIIVSTLGVIIETMPEYSAHPAFFPLEMCINALFTVEFALRLYACDSLRAFATNGYNIIDFLAIFPGYVDVLLLLTQEEQDENTGLYHVHKAAGSMRTLRMIRVVRLVRVFRVMRVAKVARHSRLLSILFAVFRKVSQSGLIVVLMLMSFVTVLSASFIYLFESELCESTGLHCMGPSAFVSIPASFWWAVATLTTVGYGDMVPHTSPGRVVGALTAVAGVIIVAIGVALVSINFREVFIEEKARADFRLRGGMAAAPDPRQEEQEILKLLSNFDQKSNALLSKLRSVTASQEDCGAEFAPMLDMLSSHSEALSSDVRVFLGRVLCGGEEEGGGEGAQVAKLRSHGSAMSGFDG